MSSFNITVLTDCFRRWTSLSVNMTWLLRVGCGSDNVLSTLLHVEDNGEIDDGHFCPSLCSNSTSKNSFCLNNFSEIRYQLRDDSQAVWWMTTTYIRAYCGSWHKYILFVCLMVFNATFKQYVSYIVAINFICGGNRRTRRKPPTCRKSLTNFTT
jgi:hypothetical protein